MKKEVQDMKNEVQAMMNEMEALQNEVEATKKNKTGVICACVCLFVVILGFLLGNNDS